MGRATAGRGNASTKGVRPAERSIGGKGFGGLAGACATEGMDIDPMGWDICCVRPRVALQVSPKAEACCRKARRVRAVEGSFKAECGAFLKQKVEHAPLVEGACS